jgi:hypothetical protein
VVVELTDYPPIINSAATTGGNAGATIKRNPKSPLLPITMASNLTKFSTTAKESIQKIFQEMLEIYNQIKTKGLDNDSGPK